MKYRQHSVTLILIPNVETVLWEKGLVSVVWLIFLDKADEYIRGLDITVDWQ